MWKAAYDVVVCPVLDLIDLEVQCHISLKSSLLLAIRDRLQEKLNLLEREKMIEKWIVP